MEGKLLRVKKKRWEGKVSVLIVYREKLLHRTEAKGSKQRTSSASVSLSRNHLDMGERKRKK